MGLDYGSNISAEQYFFLFLDRKTYHLMVIFRNKSRVSAREGRPF
jgi:hypothetical protein